PWDYGEMTVNVYNESSPSVAIPNWNIIAYDVFNNVKYSSSGNNNPVVINTSEFGLGLTYFQINATDYESRTYFTTIAKSLDYTLDAYLPFSSGTNLYYIQTINEYGAVVSDSEVIITKSLNGSIREIASGFTNAYGMYPVYLLGGGSYKINISATGYTPLVMQDLIADPNNYGYNNPIVYTFVTDPAYFVNETGFDENIEFIVETSGTTLYSNYTDSLGNTSDTMLMIYEINQTTNIETQYGWYNTSDTSSWSITNTSNDSNCYRVVLFLNHSNFGFQVLERVVCGDDLTYRGISSTS
ncbi:unnamed protein product, partial [marine sediment metagenome]